MSSRPQRRSATAISPDQELALLHMPGALRDAFRALFQLDAAMGDVVARSTEPALGRIKLAWWREQLEALDSAPPPAEPRLQAVAEHLFPQIGGAELAELEAGWATILDEDVDPELVAARGRTLFHLGGRILGSDDPRLADAGALYALASAAHRGVPELAGPAREVLGAIRSHRFGRRARPLTMLSRAAVRGLARNEPDGSRGRVLAMLAHRWTGRIG